MSQQFSYNTTPSMYAVNNLRILSLLVQRTDPMGDLYMRPFTSSLDQMVLNQITESVSEALGVTSATIAKSAGNMIRPAPVHEGVISIPEGWNSIRMRWVMRVEITDTMGTQTLEVLGGFTEYFDVSFGMHINPNMRFYINNIQTMNPTAMVNNPVNGMLEGSSVISNNQPTNTVSVDRLYALRPQDVIENIQDAAHYGAGLTFESNTNKNIGTVPIKSNLRHNAAAGYLGDLLGNFLASKASVQYQNATESPWENTYHAIKNPTVTRDGFLSRLGHATGQMLTPNSFSLNELQMLDPNVLNVFHLETSSALGYAGEYWGGSDLLTQAATIIGQSVPGYMNRFGLARAQFSLQTGMEPLVADFASITPLADPRQMLMGFKFVVQHELMATLVNGFMFVEAMVNSDLFGITTIQIRLNGVGPFTPFSFPSFCDSLAAPVISRNSTNVADIYSSMDTVLSAVGQTTMGGVY
jgi:hypothetical protein